MDKSVNIYLRGDRYMSKHYKPSEFAELINVSVKTLQRWDNEGVLKAYRTPTNRRYYTYEQYLSYEGLKATDIERKTVLYTRVSTSNQKDDLKNQVQFLRDYANASGIIVNEVIPSSIMKACPHRKNWYKI